MNESRAALSPEMLLFEVAAMCSRHGLAVSTDHPTAALDAAARLLRALGLAPHEPAAIMPAPPTAPPGRPPTADGSPWRPHRLGEPLVRGSETAVLPIVREGGRPAGHRVSRPLAAVPDGR